MSRRPRRLLVPAARAAGLAGSLTPAPAAAFAPSASPAPSARAVPAKAAHASAPVVVASRLDNPRQLAMDYRGRLVIAEAGRGGSYCVGEGLRRLCAGTTGAVSSVAHPERARGVTTRRYVRGLLSIAGPDGSFAVGPDGVAVRGRRTYIAMTNIDPAENVQLPSRLPRKQLGKLLRAKNGKLRAIADISALERRLNPDRGTRPDGRPDLNSNPYAVLALRRGRWLVADAGGNTVIEVRKRHGRYTTRVFAVLPKHDGRESVPTSLALGPNGLVYVGELGGETPGKARVYRFTQQGQRRGYLSGFTTVTGVALDHRGALYVSQLFSGQVTKVRHGRRTTVSVPFPAGVVADRRGNVYVSAWSIADRDGAADLDPETPGAQPSPPGQVWRLRF